MASDLIVDATLDDTNRDLKAIREEFSTAKENADRNSGIWGQSDLASAMNEFVDNWFVHRDKINDRLGKLSERVDQACAAWGEAEKQLASSLQVDGNQNG